MNKPNLFSILKARGFTLTRDIAILYKMEPFFAGDVNRAHPVSIEPNLVDASNPPTFYGQAVLLDAATGGVRPVTAADSAITDIYGIIARPYPTQQAQTNQNFGASPIGPVAPPTSGIQDVVRSGYVAVPVNGNAAKGGTVYIWVAAPSGSHVTGGFEAAASGGNTATLTSPKTTYNGVTSAKGLVELAYNI